VEPAPKAKLTSRVVAIGGKKRIGGKSPKRQTRSLKILLKFGEKLVFPETR